MHAQITELLDTIGVDAATQARLELFSRVPGPSQFGKDPEQIKAEFLDATPVTVSLTAGQAILLRGGLRFALEALMESHAQAAMLMHLTGATPEDMFLDGGASLSYKSYLDCEDVLAEAMADLTPVSVPDAVPDDWS